MDDVLYLQYMNHFLSLLCKCYKSSTVNTEQGSQTSKRIQENKQIHSYFLATHIVGAEKKKLHSITKKNKI